MTYKFSEDKSRVDVSVVHRFLANESYWAAGRSFEAVERSIENSYCLGFYTQDDQLAAFARVVTDWATVYYVCDLFVLPAHRGQGLGKRLVKRITTHPRLRYLTGMLLTADAHALYSAFGFIQNEESSARFMLRRGSGQQQQPDSR